MGPTAFRCRRGRSLRFRIGVRSSVAFSLALFGACAPAAPEPGVDTTGPRIVAMVPSLSELVIAMGAGAHLVARTDHDTDPASSHLPSVGGGLDPSLEVLVALDVDVVLTTSARETAALAQRLGDLGIETRVLPTNTLEDVFAAIESLGALLDVEEAADSLSRSLKDGLTEVSERVAGLPAVTALYVVWYDPPMTTGGGTFIDDLMGVAGGANVFADLPAAWPNVGFESIVARNPDVVLWPAGEAEDLVGFVQSLPGWRDLPAVRAGRVAFVDARALNRPGPGLVESARVLARALHPEVF
jgi:iron complex transport system substrate-binding protein